MALNTQNFTNQQRVRVKNDKEKFKNYLKLKTGEEKEEYRTIEVLKICTNVIKTEKLYDEGNPEIILCDELLEEAINMKAMHVTQARSVICYQLEEVKTPRDGIPNEKDNSQEVGQIKHSMADMSTLEVLELILPKEPRTSVRATPTKNTMEWHKQIDDNLRNNAVDWLTKTLLPVPYQLAVLDKRMHKVVSFTRSIELNLYKMAKSRNDYYYNLELRRYRIKEELKNKKEARQKEEIIKELDQGGEKGNERVERIEDSKRDEKQHEEDNKMETVKDSTIGDNSLFTLKPEFEEILLPNTHHILGKKNYTYKEIADLLSEYIKGNKIRLFDMRNIYIAMVEKDDLGKIFGVKAFHKRQVGIYIRKQLQPASTSHCEGCEITITGRWCRSCWENKKERWPKRPYQRKKRKQHPDQKEEKQKREDKRRKYSAYKQSTSEEEKETEASDEGIYLKAK